MVRQAVDLSQPELVEDLAGAELVLHHGVHLVEQVRILIEHGACACFWQTKTYLERGPAILRVPVWVLRQADVFVSAGDNLELVVWAGVRAAALGKPLIQGAVESPDVSMRGHRTLALRIKLGSVPAAP